MGRNIDYSYVHATKNGFSRRADVLMRYPTQTDISNVYMENAAYIKSRYLAERVFEENVDKNDIYEREMQQVLDLFATANSRDVFGNIIESEYEKNSKQIIEQVKNATTAQSTFLSGTGKGKDLNIQDVMNDVKRLDNYVKSLKQLLKDLKQYNAQAVALAADTKKTTKSAISRLSGTSMADPTDGYYVMSVNTTGNTSLKNLAEKVKILESLNKELKTGGNTDVANTTVSYYDHKDEKTRTRKASDLVGGIGYQITNIQGAIGEFVSYQMAEDAIEKGVLEPLARAHAGEISVRGAGSDTVENKSIGVQATSVGDIKIEIKNNEVVITVIGISAKAQFSGGDNKSSTTTFGTTTVEGVLSRAEALGSQYDYLFVNGLAHNHNFDMKTSGSEKASMLRRYIAARAMKYMLGGLGGSPVLGKGNTKSGSRDEVYFLKYADAIYRVDKYFEKLAKESSSTKLPVVNASMSGVSLPDLDVNDKYARSKEARKLLLRLKASVSKRL